MTTAVIVQARLGSTRLPGKVLKPLGRHTVLEEVLRRCKAIGGADVVVCAIPEQAEDDVLMRAIERAGAVVARGPSADVLARYAMAARAADADVIMRVTSDCPLIDPEVCAEVLALRERDGADYACNNMPPGFPHGLDCECFTRDSLDRAAREAGDAHEREHVTPWHRTRPGVSRAVLHGPGGAAARRRWTIDYAEDYAFLCALWRWLPPAPAIPSWREVVALLAEHPEIEAINRQHAVARSA